MLKISVLNLANYFNNFAKFGTDIFFLFLFADWTVFSFKFIQGRLAPLQVYTGASGSPSSFVWITIHRISINFLLKNCFFSFKVFFLKVICSFLLFPTFYILSNMSPRFAFCYMFYHIWAFCKQFEEFCKQFHVFNVTGLKLLKKIDNEHIFPLFEYF